MRLIVNGTPTDMPTEAEATTLAEALIALGYGGAKVATAVNEVFVASVARAGHMLREGDRLEILAPRQGG